MNVQIISKKLCGFHRNESGAVAIMFVFFLNIMLGMLALALDLGRGYLAGAEIQNAATAASISSAMEDGDVPAAKRYFISNLPSGLHSITYDFDSDVQVVINGGSVSVIPTGFDVPAFFPMGDVSGSAAGGSLIQVGSISTVGMPSAAVVPADYLFITDVSGSMSMPDSICPNGQPCTRMQAVKDSSLNLIGTIAGTPGSDQNYSVGLVAWTTAVTGTLPLTNDFAQATTSTNALLFPQGATCGACGLLAGAQVVVNAPPNGRQKVVMFLTDGSMNVSPNNNPPFPAAITACQALKMLPDVSVWALTFGNDALGNPQNVALRNSCASSPGQSIHVANGQELNSLFGQIFNVTGRIRVTQ